MVPKALLKKEWKHASILIWAIIVVCFIQFPLMIGLQIEEWKELKDDPFFRDNISHHLYSAFSGSIFTAILVGLIFGLAAVLIGKERNSKRNDFSLALPFSRRSMYGTKIILGLGSILIPFIVSYWIGYFLVWQSEFSYMLSQLRILETFVAPLAGYFVIFMFTMFIGSFTGDMRSQLSLSVIFLVLPPGLFIMIREFWILHQFGYLQFWELPHKFFWPMYLLGNTVQMQDLLYPIISGVIFFLLGMLLFERAPAERSGEFIVFNSFKPFFNVVILICSFLLGGLIMTAFIPYSLPIGAKIIAYWIGAVIAVGFAWLISKKFLGLYER